MTTCGDRIGDGTSAEGTETGPILEAIGRAECYELLSSRNVGRAAVARAGRGPLVVPVNYGMDNRAILFRSDEGSKLWALREGPISFEVDDVDPFHRTGWSVLMEGRAYELQQWETRSKQLDPWAPGARAHWVRLVPTEISGRRIRLVQPDVDQRGYR